MSFDISSVFEKENSGSINLEGGTSITINSNGSKAPITILETLSLFVSPAVFFVSHTF